LARHSTLSKSVEAMCDRGNSLGFGERMRREREMRGIALDEIVNATKIGSRTLRALEEEDFSKLPGGIFNKGFVRAYARYLGIDEEQAVADYLAALGESKSSDAAEAEHLKKTESSWKPSRLEDSSTDFSDLPWKPLILLLLLLTGMFAVWHFRHSAFDHFRQWETHWRQPRQQTLAAPPAPAPPQAAPVKTVVPVQTVVPAGDRASPTTPVVAVSTASMPNSPPVPVSLPTPAPTESVDPSPEFVVQFHAREDSWVSITADGKPIMKGNLIARRETTIRAKHNITLVAGNAAGLDVSFNGKPLGGLGGKSHEVRTVVFNSAGLQP
jgi:hypothetical protein